MINNINLKQNKNQTIQIAILQFKFIAKFQSKTVFRFKNNSWKAAQLKLKVVQGNDE